MRILWRSGKALHLLARHGAQVPEVYLRAAAQAHSQASPHHRLPDGSEHIQLAHLAEALQYWPRMME
jgi:hypothetical protein